MVGKKTEKSQSWTRSTEQAEDIIALMSANTICSSSLHPHKPVQPLLPTGGCSQPPTQVAASPLPTLVHPQNSHPQCNHEVHCLPCKALSSLRQELGWSRPPPSPQYLTHCLNLVGVQLNTCGQDWMGSPDLRNPFNAVLQAASINPFKLTQDLKSLYHLTINKSKLSESNIH